MALAGLMGFQVGVRAGHSDRICSLFPLGAILNMGAASRKLHLF
jgi:hypothetical protein